MSKYKQRLHVKAKIDTGLGSATAQKEANTKSTKSLENQEAEKAEPQQHSSKASPPAPQRQLSREVIRLETVPVTTKEKIEITDEKEEVAVVMPHHADLQQTPSSI